MPTIRIGRRGLPLLSATMLLGCSYGPKPDKRTDFVLFFVGDVLDFDRMGRATLDRAAVASRTAPDLDVTVAGFQDDPTTPESNQIRSRIRAQNVANALVQRGIPRDRIRLVPRRALGADPGVESKRVDIRIGS